MARSGKGRSSSRSKSFGLAGIGEKQNPAARKSQETSSRDSVDRQGRFESPIPRTGMPSNTQQRRKAAGSPQTGLQPGATGAGHGPSQAAINLRHDDPPTFDSSTGRYSDPVPRKLTGPPSAAEVDWTGPDALSLMNPEVATTTIQGAGGRQWDEFRETGPNLSNPYRNEPSYNTGPTGKDWVKQPSVVRQASTQTAYRAADDPMGRERRQASTQTAYHLADSAPLKDYKPRGKVVADKKTNIQAFY